MTASAKKRIAVFGGAFDPPHYAHLFAIQTLNMREDVDEVWLVPTFQHVFNKRMTDFERRCDWLQTCVDAAGWSDKVRVQRIEAELGGESRTYDTLDHLSSFHANASFCFVIGADNLAMSNRWYRFDDLVKRWSLIVFGRPGFEKVMRQFSKADWCRVAINLPSVSSSMIRAGIQRSDVETIEMIPPPIRDDVLQQFSSIQPLNSESALEVRILGLGRVGQSLQHTFAEFGIPAEGWSRRKSPLNEYLRDVPFSKNEVILLTVSDPAIDEVLEEIIPALDGTQVVLHCAGARGAAIREGLAFERTGVLHPIRAIPNGETMLTHQVWGISGGDIAQARAREIITLFEGDFLRVPDDEAATYHAAMVIAGNFPLALQAISEALIQSLGADESVGRRALRTLHQGALENVSDNTIADVLTGPIARRDLDTIQTHFTVLQSIDPEIATWYRQTSRLLSNCIGWHEGADALTVS